MGTDVGMSFSSSTSTTSSSSSSLIVSAVALYYDLGRFAHSPAHSTHMGVTLDSRCDSFVCLTCGHRWTTAV